MFSPRTKNLFGLIVGLAMIGLIVACIAYRAIYFRGSPEMTRYPQAPKERKSYLPPGTRQVPPEKAPSKEVARPTPPRSPD